MQSTQSDVKEYSYFAGNQWRKAADNQVFEVHEPYSGKLFARVAAGSRADGRTAVDAAAKAFEGWAETTPAEKARLFLKASEIVKRRRSEIAEVLARETGSTISFATFQQDLVAATLQQVAGWVYLPKGEVLETNLPGSLRQHACGLDSADQIDDPDFGTIEELVRNGARGSWRMSNNVNHPRREPGFLRDLCEHNSC